MSLRTSEWVSPGHPDKIADNISEYILDRILEKDSKARYALECQIKDNFVTLAGELTTITDVTFYNILDWVKESVNKIGYTKEYQEKWGKENTICGDDIFVTTHISKQSPNISQGVDNNGVGDQGVFAGYAENNINTNYMPLDYFLSKELGMILYNYSKENNVGGLDIKTQITLDDDVIKQVIVAIPVLTDDEFEEINSIVQFWLEVTHKTTNAEIIINGTGKYQIHGPIGDSGTTGRKLAVDLYGLNCFIGGGALVTKDATKADLTLNLYSRQKAIQGLKEYNKNNNILAHHSIYKTSCCIGKSKILGCLSIYDKNGNIIFSKDEIEVIDLNRIIENYGLRKPIFSNLCTNGFLGNNYPWEE